MMRLAPSRPHPGYHKLADALDAAGLSSAAPERQPLVQARAQAEAYYRFVGGAPTPLAHVSDHAIAGPAGDIRLRLFHPGGAQPLALAVYFHGGGYALNSIDTHDALMRRIAAEAGVAVCGVGYGKAPETRYPGQLHEALQVLDWLQSDGHALGIAPDHLVLMGDSAGAHLALTAALALPAERCRALRGLVLAYGMFAPDFDTDSHHLFGGGDYGLTSRRMRWFWDQFLPQGQDLTDPLVAPLHADLSNLPPLLLVAAELDCLRDDSLRLAQRLALAGRPHRLSVYPDVQHAFLMAHPWLEPARDAIGEIAATLKAWLAD
jgi:acetyl esterase